MANVWSIGVDWLGKGFPAMDYVAGDFLNDLPTWIDNHTDFANIPHMISTGTLTTLPILEPFGRDAWRYDFASAAIFKIFRSASIDQAPIFTTNTRRYKVVFWYRMISQDTSGGANVTTPTLYSNDDTTLEVTGTALGQSTSWTQTSLGFTASASDNLVLRITKNAAGASTIEYDFSGFMVIEDTGAITTPAGYNYGLLDAYDVITSDTIEASWEGGLNSYETIAGEKRAQLLLNNNHKRYSPEYASSPIYGYALPGRVVVIYASAVKQYVGRLDLLTPTPDKAADQVARLVTTNLVSELKRHVQTLTVDAAKPVDGLIYNELVVFNQRLADATAYAESLNSEIIAAYYGDNTGTPSIWQAFGELSEIEWGKLFISKEGVITLLPRSWDKSTSTISPDATWDNSTILRYLPTASRITTRLNVKVYPRNIGASGTDTLWTLRGSRVIPAGKVYTFKARYTNADGQRIGAKDVVTPTGADYTITGGTPVLTFTPGGEQAIVKIDNTAGATDATLSVMVIKGKKIETFDTSELTYENAHLIETYGYQDFSLDLKAFDDINDAYDLAEWVFPTLSLERGEILQATLINEDNGTANALNISLDVGDIVSISDDQLGIDNLFYNIVGYKHTLDVVGKSHISTFNLEIAHKQTYWILGVSRLGLETRLGR